MKNQCCEKSWREEYIRIYHQIATHVFVFWMSYKSSPVMGMVWYLHDDCNVGIIVKYPLH